jgi:hypothetical protein
VYLRYKDQSRRDIINVGGPLFKVFVILSGFNQNGICRPILVKIPNMIFYKNPAGGSRDLPGGQRDGRIWRDESKMGSGAQLFVLTNFYNYV